MNIRLVQKLFPFLLVSDIIGGIAILSIPNDTLNSNKALSLGICIPVVIIGIVALVFAVILFRHGGK